MGSSPIGSAGFLSSESPVPAGFFLSHVPIGLSVPLGAPPAAQSRHRSDPPRSARLLTCMGCQSSRRPRHADSNSSPWETPPSRGNGVVPRRSRLPHRRVKASDAGFRVAVFDRASTHAPCTQPMARYPTRSIALTSLLELRVQSSSAPFAGAIMRPIVSTEELSGRARRSTGSVSRPVLTNGRSYGRPRWILLRPRARVPFLLPPVVQVDVRLRLGFDRRLRRVRLAPTSPRTSSVHHAPPVQPRRTLEVHNRFPGRSRRNQQRRQPRPRSVRTAHKALVPL